MLVSFEGDVKLIDFGIAKAESRLQRTQAGILKGKFSYMSPEQVRGQAIDHRSDIFAVGVLLWELLCGEKLFTGDSDFAVLEKVRTGQIPLPRKVNPDIPEALEKVMMKALATEVRDRYQWASELHDALVRFTLIGDMVYGSRQLAEWMREEFHLEFEKEQKRLRSWLGIGDAEVEVTPSDPMRRKPLPRMPSDLQQQLVPPPRPPAPPLESEPEPLVQAPTPTGVRHRVPASKTATPPPGELRPVAKPPAPPAQPPPLPPAEDLSHELPTMKMDGNALAAAEKALAEQRAKAGEPRPFGVDDEESTVREDGPAAKEAKAKAEAQAARQAENARLFDERPPSSPGASAPPAPRPITLKDRPTAPRLPASLDPALLAGERLQPLPIQRASPQPPPPPPISAPPLSPPPPAPPPPPLADAFDVSEERTAAPRAQRTGALSKPVRDDKPAAHADARNHVGRNLLLAAAVLLASLGAAWFLWPSEIAAPGRLVLALTPSVPAELVIDGKPAGAIPPFVWQLARGPHRIEIHAAGFKPFSASVRISSPSKPTELAVALVSDAPLEVEGGDPQPESNPDPRAGSAGGGAARADPSALAHRKAGQGRRGQAARAGARASERAGRRDARSPGRDADRSGPGRGALSRCARAAARGPQLGARRRLLARRRVAQARFRRAPRRGQAARRSHPPQGEHHAAGRGHRHRRAIGGEEPAHRARPRHRDGPHRRRLARGLQAGAPRRQGLR